MSISNGVAALVNTTGVPIGDKKLTVSSTVTAQGRRKVSVKLAIPVVQDAVVGGVSRPTVVRTAYVELNFSFDATSNTTERGDTVGYMWSLLGSTLMANLVDDLQTLY